MRERQVRTSKESNRARGTHMLETEEGGTSQVTERKRPSKGHSLSRGGRGRGESKHERQATERRALTSCKWQKGGQVRTQKGSNQVGDAHHLEIIEGATSQDMARKRLSKGCSQPGDSRVRNKSAHRKKATE